MSPFTRAHARDPNRNSRSLVRNDRKESAWLGDRRDHLEFDRDRRRQRKDFNRRARRIRFAGAGKMFRVEFVIDRKILLHVGEEDRDIDDVVPARAGVFQNEPDVFEHRAALRFDVVADDVAGASSVTPGISLLPRTRGPMPERKSKLPTRFACGNAPTGSGARELSKDLLIYRALHASNFKLSPRNSTLSPDPSSQTFNRRQDIFEGRTVDIPDSQE